MRVIWIIGLMLAFALAATFAALLGMSSLFVLTTLTMGLVAGMVVAIIMGDGP